MTTVKELKQQLHDDLEELRERLRQYVQETELGREVAGESGQVRFEATINDVHEAVEAMREPDEPSQQAALEAVAALGSLNAQLSYFDARAALQLTVQPMVQAAVNAWNGLAGYLKSILQKLSSQLWQLVSKLLKLKEWSVSGSAGMSLFGLAGTAQIQLTFG